MPSDRRKRARINLMRGRNSNLSADRRLSLLLVCLSIVWLVVGIVGVVRTNGLLMGFGFGLFLLFGWGSFTLRPSRIRANPGFPQDQDSLLEALFRRLRFTWAVGPPRSNDKENNVPVRKDEGP
jgi:hypothetical protein